MIRAPLYSARMPPEMTAKINAYLERLTIAQLERLARSTPAEAARLMGIQVEGLAEDGDGLGWVQFVIMAASAVLANKKKKDAQKKANETAKREEAQMQRDEAALQANQKRAAAKAAANPSTMPKWPMIAGGVAILAGIVYILTRKRKRQQK